MRKVYALLVLMLSASLFYSCGNNPQSPAESSFKKLDANSHLNGFETGMDISVSGINGTWSVETDSAESGVTLPFYSIVTWTKSEGEYAFSMTVTADDAAVAYPGSTVFSGRDSDDGYSKASYAKVILTLSEPVNMTSNTRLVYRHFSPTYSSPNADQRIIIYDNQNRYAFSDSMPMYFTAGTLWTDVAVSFSGLHLPAGAAYNVNDVISAAVKIIWVPRWRTSSSGSIVYHYMLDNVWLMS